MSYLNKPVLLSGGIVKPEQITAGIVQQQPIAGGAVVPEIVPVPGGSGGGGGSKPLNLSNYLDAIVYQQRSSLDLEDVKNILQKGYDYFVDLKTISKGMNFGPRAALNDFQITLTSPILIKKIQVRGHSYNSTTGNSNLSIGEWVDNGVREWHEFNFPDTTFVDKQVDVNSNIATQKLSFVYTGLTTKTIYVQIQGVYIEFELA